MKKTAIIAIACGIATLGGCDSQSQQNGKKGIEVNWPGGGVKIDPESGVSVEAPGVNVDVKPGERVDVKAGEVEVNQESGKGVDVKVPGVDVTTRADGSPQPEN